MKNFNYSTFTRKQANVLYAAVKRDELVMSKDDTRRMYNLVGVCGLDYDECAFRGRLERAISHLVEGRIEYAQLELDGHMVCYECVRKETYLREYDEMRDFFKDPDENGMVEDIHCVYDWVIH